MKVYSKKDLWLSILLWLASIGPAIGLIAAYLTGDLNVIALIICVSVLGIVSLFLIWIWFTTYYIISDVELIIAYGPFKKKIPFDSIISIKKSHNPLAGPALSLHRIEIMYNTYNMTYISPVDRESFIEKLAQKCPQVNLKQSN